MSSNRISIVIGFVCTGLAGKGLAVQEPLDTERDWMLANRSRIEAAPLRQETPSDAATWDWARADARAPAGVVFTDTLDHDEWMVHLRYTRVEQDGLRDNEEDVSNDEIFAAGYTTAAQEMSTDTVELQVFYGWEERWTLFAELPWLAREMESLSDDGVEFSTESDGIGDVKLGALRTVHEADGQRLIANLGLSVPTGSVDEADEDENSTRTTLPYPMQLGTGTYDIHPGVSWMMQYDTWSWGAQGQWRLHIGRNDEDWAWSDDGDISAWVARSFSPAIAGSLRVRGYFWGDVHGSSDEMDPDADPLEDRHLQGGERYDLVGGLTWQPGSGYETIRTLNVEIGKPVVEWLDGPALSTDIYLIVGWRYSF